MDPSHTPYLTSGSANSELIVRRSRFVGSIAPVQTEARALDFIAGVRAAHPGATHNVYCYALREENTIRFSDAGEPSGTAGKPALEVLLKNRVWDSCIVVTRYFGGVLLGAGGLVRAYSSCASAALEAAGVVRMAPMQEVFVQFSYPDWARAEPALAVAGHLPVSTEYGAEITALFAAPPEEIEKISAAAADSSAGRAIVRPGEISMRGEKVLTLRGSAARGANT